jgi:tetratricopeptide (TPR) repeat protein
MKYLLIIAVGLFSLNINGQEQSKEYKKSFKLAHEKYVFGDYYGALKMYNQLYLLNPEDEELNFNLGICHYYTQNFKEAEANFLKSSSTISKELFRYKALIAHINMKFKKAINYFNAYKLVIGEKEVSNVEINRLILKTRFAESSILNGRKVLVQNVGKTINSEYQEYVPLISADEEMMLFTSRRPGSSGGLLDPNGMPFEDVYVAKKNNNIWEKPEALKKEINTPSNDACVGLSADGQLLFLFRTSEDQMTGDIYQSRMGLTDWETPVKLGSDINTKYNETSASITLDDKVIYFSSDRPGGFGGKDIYRVIRLPNGEWSSAFNLGPTVNTPYDEDAPFIATDRKTLYFSSKGHQNMGGYDIFITVLEKSIWSAPENLKYPINTVQDDIFFVMAASGKVGYYSSTRVEGFGGQDIYRVLLKDENVKQHVLKAEVISKKGEEPLFAKIMLIENESKKVKGIYNSNNNTGRFIMLVDPNKTYNVVIESDNYHSYSTELIFDINKSEKFIYTLEKKN